LNLEVGGSSPSQVIKYRCNICDKHLSMINTVKHSFLYICHCIVKYIPYVFVIGLLFDLVAWFVVASCILEVANALCIVCEDISVHCFKYSSPDIIIIVTICTFLV
jgi:hypothetical protein